MSRPVRTFADLPDPGQAATLDDLVERLRRLKVWAGDPSFERITAAVNAEWTRAGRPAGELARKTTVVDCFRAGRRRVNADLVVGVVQALHPDAGYVSHWRQVLRVIGGEAAAAAQVRVRGALPDDLPRFTGREAELAVLRRAAAGGWVAAGGRVAIATIEGMAGAGKTRLAVHAAHVLARERAFARVLFVDLRGFDPDQPPADPAAVLDGFLRLLGVPGTEVPHDLPDRVAAYRERIADALVVLDNAADEAQVRPLLPDAPGCVALVTSRRGLTGLEATARVSIDVFTPADAVAFLADEVGDVPRGDDPSALARIAGRCGYLPLALGLIAGHIRAAAGWTLTDHADRLDDRHRLHRLDTGVELALDVSYRRLPADRRRLLRLTALHPTGEFDAHAAAALADTDLATARAHLEHLHHDHLVQGTAGRYSFHDLVRAHASGRAADEDPPSARHAAVTRLFAYQLATASAAMDTLHPAEADRRPRVAAATTPVPDVTDADAALAWLDTERPALVTSAAHGSPAHAVHLSLTLFRHLNNGHPVDALTLHGHAHDAARELDDPSLLAHVLTNLAATHLQLRQAEPAAEYLHEALELFRRAEDSAGAARALTNLGVVDTRLGRFQQAADRYGQALGLCRDTGDRAAEARVLTNLAGVEERLGRYESAADHLELALRLCRDLGDRDDEAWAMEGLGSVEVKLGRHESAIDHYEQASARYRQLGNRSGEAWAAEGLGTLHAHLGDCERAAEHYARALAAFREIGDRDGEAYALNGLGETAAESSAAVHHHTAALSLAVEIDATDQRARAHAGLGRALGSREHYEQALALFTELDAPEAEQLRALLADEAGAPPRDASASTPPHE
ncbi:tetratricopeptide repeat protein [Saccharothrix deserti]|uniref:tetratricopeptide repeat protein n=1 Tax=Saccharothrix deserti TaxID=2593674 RepID=UPI001EE3C649|nr:tetratricopeptide repeat protein [Saccharothrix deserti]